MKLSYVKILPLLIFVVFLAFSVRLADVVYGFANLQGAAEAAAAATTEPAPSQAELKPAATAAEEQKKAEAAAETKPVDPAGVTPEAAKPADPAATTAEAKPAVPEVETPTWHDADDSDSSFGDVRGELYDTLGKRREELDKRESDMVTREALLRAAEQEIDRKYEELSKLRGEIQKLLEEQSAEEQGRIGSLVKIYEGMKPADAARIFDTLDIDVLMQVMSRMSERKLSPIMAVMNPERAKTMTIMLAEQKQLPQLPPAN